MKKKVFWCDRPDVVRLDKLRVGTWFRSMENGEFQIKRKEQNIIHVIGRDGKRTIFAPCADGIPLKKGGRS